MKQIQDETGVSEIEHGAGSGSGLPYRWRLSFAMFSLALATILVFLFVAKQTFESDKIPSVFGSRQAELAMMSRQLSANLERGLVLTQSLLIGYNPAKRALSPLAQTFFDSEPSLLGLEVSDLDDHKPLISIAKSDSIHDILKSAVVDQLTATYGARAIDGGRFLITSRDSNRSRTFIRALINVPDLLKSESQHGSMILLDEMRVVLKAGPTDLPGTLIREIAADRFASTMDREIDGRRYLITAHAVPNSRIKLVSVDSKEEAFAAVRALYSRTLLLVIFISCLALLIAFALSTGLTRKLFALSEIAGRIGQGDFSQKIIPHRRGGEIGILETAFARMSGEIQKLLIDTKEKTRMEEELKTARLVQERLFPRDANFELQSISLSGFYDTSTECGGDWWYYFRRGDEILVAVADATGHGTPAALSTAASRSVFARLEDEQRLSLEEIASAWDRSIAASSGQQVFMTAFLVLIDTKSGRGRYLNASHESPILIQNGTAEFLDTQASSRLGDLKGNWTSGDLVLDAGSRLILFTDGLWAVETAEGKTFGEARFLKKVAKLSESNSSSKDFLQAICSTIELHRQGHPYPDDVTLVVLDRLQP